MIRSLCLSLLVVAACGAPNAAAPPAKVAIASAAAAPATGKFVWSDFDHGIFERAKKEKRFVVLDGAAEWCHFCHVMEEKTYADPRVRELLEKHFIAAKVDVDARPDIEERYGDWGWPATVLFSPEGEELGKYRGYIPPDDFLQILRDVVSGAAKRQDSEDDGIARAPKTPLGDDALDLAKRFVETEIEEYWDPKEGGWGKEPKVPIGWNALWALAKAKEGNAKQREHALVVLDKQRKIIDPVWGGIYQYSVAPDWDHPHYEKLMFWNAGALASYAEAFALTNDAKWKGAALDIRRFLDAFMISPGGGFYGTQDADLNSHPASVPFAPTSPRGKGEFMKGEDYYKLGDRERRALGVPRIDPNEYADDNGLAIFAYVTLARAAGDSSALETAKRAADRILATCELPSGAVLHTAPEPVKEGELVPKATRRIHLSDNAAFGFGLAHLAAWSKDGRFHDKAARIAAVMEKELYDADGGGFFSQPHNPDAVGVFRVRRKPFDENVLALRFLVLLDTIEGAAKRRGMIEHSLRAISNPAALKGRGKFLGDYLALVDEVVAYRKLPTSERVKPK